jgi:hypothetical protein
MIMENQSEQFWRNAMSKSLSSNRKLIFPKGSKTPSPRESNLFKRSIGEVKGQIADWRASVNNEDKCVHIVEFRNRYEVHVDKYDPRKKPIEHLLFDSPVYGAIIATGAAVAIAVIKSIFS